MKLSDYVVEFLASQGIKYNFLVSGGAVIHLVDSTAKHPSMQYICGQHEEHSASAADMYSRVTGELGVVMTTSGPGATNIVTSVANAYFDSIPLLCITGQVSRFRLKKSQGLRQRGFQETDVVAIFSSITKYCAIVLRGEDIRYELEKALYYAKEGRPGPVLLDIPDDLQREDIDPKKLRPFIPPKVSTKVPTEQIENLLRALTEAQRPVCIFGAGIQIAKAADLARRFVEHFHIPVVCTWGGADVLPHAHPLHMGRIGVCGPRGGNFGLQNADFILALGTRLSPMVTGGKQNLFAPKARKAMVDIDIEELKKFGEDTFVLDFLICMNLRDFFQEVQKREIFVEDAYCSWRKQIQVWRDRYPLYSKENVDPKGKVHPHLFIKKLSDLAEEGDILLGDTGANLSWILQSFEQKSGQRIFSAWNHTPMGYSLPASIGAALASNRRVICLIGDGGFMMCLQELATIRRHNLPILIFLFNNGGHAIQKQTIDTWLQGNYAAVDEASGLYFPKYEKIAEAFQIPFHTIATQQDLELLPEIWRHRGPYLCDIHIMEKQKIDPMLKFGSGIEDLDPKLSSEELEQVVEECMALQKESCSR